MRSVPRRALRRCRGWGAEAREFRRRRFPGHLGQRCSSRSSLWRCDVRRGERRRELAGLGVERADVDDARTDTAGQDRQGDGGGEDVIPRIVEVVPARTVEGYQPAAEDGAHEGVADLVAVLTAFNSHNLREAVLGRTGGEIKRSTAFSAVAEEFGERPRAHTQFWAYIQDIANEGLVETKVVGDSQGGGRTTYISLPDIPAKVLRERLECTIH